MERSRSPSPTCCGCFPKLTLFRKRASAYQRPIEEEQIQELQNEKRGVARKLELVNRQLKKLKKRDRVRKEEEEREAAEWKRSMVEEWERVREEREELERLRELELKNMRAERKVKKVLDGKECLRAIEKDLKCLEGRVSWQDSELQRFRKTDEALERDLKILAAIQREEDRKCPMSHVKVLQDLRRDKKWKLESLKANMREMELRRDLKELQERIEFIEFQLDSEKGKTGTGDWDSKEGKGKKREREKNLQKEQEKLDHLRKKFLKMEKQLEAEKQAAKDREAALLEEMEKKREAQRQRLEKQKKRNEELLERLRETELEKETQKEQKRKEEQMEKQLRKMERKFRKEREREEAKWRQMLQKQEEEWQEKFLEMESAREEQMRVEKEKTLEMEREQEHAKKQQREFAKLKMERRERKREEEKQKREEEEEQKREEERRAEEKQKERQLQEEREELEWQRRIFEENERKREERLRIMERNLEERAKLEMEKRERQREEEQKREEEEQRREEASQLENGEEERKEQMEEKSHPELETEKEKKQEDVKPDEQQERERIEKMRQEYQEKEKRRKKQLKTRMLGQEGMFRPLIGFEGRKSSRRPRIVNKEVDEAPEKVEEPQMQEKSRQSCWPVSPNGGPLLIMVQPRNWSPGFEGEPQEESSPEPEAPVSEQAVSESDCSTKKEENETSCHSKIPSSCEKEELKDFVLRPAELATLVKCSIVRDANVRGNSLYPTYFLFQEDTDGNKKFLLSARNKNKTMTGDYEISVDSAGRSFEGENLVGKLSSNMVGTKWTLCGNNTEPSKVRRALFKKKTPQQELAAICFESNMLDDIPLRMKIILPGVNADGSPAHFDNGSLIKNWQKGKHENITQLCNKEPEWKQKTESYHLDFSGFRPRGSRKNFQLVHPDQPDNLLMQFGRVGDDEFKMHYEYPMCPLQAFSIGLSNIHSKIACQ